MEIAKRARFIELAGIDIAHVINVDGVFNAIPSAPVSHQALCIAALIDNPTLAEERAATIDRDLAVAVIDRELFNPALGDPTFKLFYADLTTAEFSNGDINTLSDVATAGQFSTACQAVGLPDLGAAAFTLQSHLVEALD